MSDSCCAPPAPGADPRYRKILWLALVLNGAMFAVEIAASAQSGSVSLLADAIDFLGDAANYGISLAVLGLTITRRARASLVKAACMGVFGVFVLGRALVSFMQGGLPEAEELRLRAACLPRTGDSCAAFLAASPAFAAGPTSTTQGLLAQRAPTIPWYSGLETWRVADRSVVARSSKAPLRKFR